MDPLLSIKPSVAFEVFHMDFLVAPCEAIGGYKYSLVLIDVFPKYVYPVFTKTRKATVVVANLQSLFVQQGNFPKMLVIDRESAFVSQDLEDWCAANHVMTKKLKLVIYPCEPEALRLAVMSDAEWAANVVDRKSVGGDLIYF